MRLLSRLLSSLLSIAVVAGVAMSLVRFGPGFESDERDLDPTVSESTRRALHDGQAAEGRLATYLSRASHGDFGESRALGVPVRQLIAERGPATLRILLTGTAVAWTSGLLWAAAVVISGMRWLAGVSSLLNGSLLCLPTAAIAALMLDVGWSAGMVLGLVLAPKIFEVCRSLITQALRHTEALAARARGLRTARILGWYVAPRIAGPMLAWFAATVGLAVAAVVPIEVICDVPGLGQLAWKASLARDLPVMVVLTVLVAAIIQLSNMAANAGCGGATRVAAHDH